MNKKDIKSYKILDNNDELIIDSLLRYHLYRNCEELTKDIEAVYATSYFNNMWKYRDINGFEHLFDSNNIELTKDIKTMFCHAYNNGYWKYMSKNGSWNVIDTTGKNISKHILYIHDCHIYDNGDFDYCTEQDGEYVLQKI